ncbi:exodeoxyribonuclease V subunit beta [Xylophilus sp. Kf1]|nr:exodeoxyribonuclease V subunit beta [Xylophilus sp. Kf1]
MSHALDPLTLPLWGSRLIEASAGTGKTWTIAALYLRLVLGHGEPGTDAGFGRPLIPSEILVMTFTRAATRELSDRVRARLLEAARVFRGEQPTEDALLLALLAACAEGPVRANAAWRLAVAAESMDDAAVFTIDGWCQRMLREHAFDSGSLFDEELAANETAMQHEAAQDYWRQQVYPLSGAALDLALSVWKNVDGLYADTRALKEQPLPEGAGAGSLADCIDRAVAAQAEALAALKTGWAERARDMLGWIDARMAARPAVFDGRKLAARHYTGWLKALETWAQDPAIDRPDVKTGASRLTPQGLHEALKPDQSVDLPAWFAEFETLMRALEAATPPATPVRLHAAAQVSARLALLKKLAGSFGFADMLDRLDRALDPAVNPEAAVRLRERIVAQYPVALVDEFQDTAPVQARIFDRLYRIADNDRATALLLIGDPKQSIYGFRGADIHSYLLARRATEGRHYVLGTNHRSTASVVAGVNHLFERIERAAGGEGSFRYRGPAGNPLPFEPVQARGRPESLVSAGGPVPAVTLSLDGELLSRNASTRVFAARCAEHIVGLLNDPQAGFERPDRPFVRLRPADIAVLVRTGREAAAIQRELQRRLVASVYLSDQQSVFSSAEAQDLLHWLRAVASPLDIRLARAALATRSVGLSIAELMRLADDDEAFDARSEQLRQLHGVWQQQGVLTMLRQTLHLLDLPARWLGQGQGQGDVPGATAVAEPDGERRLTNFLHLAELLQTASTQLDGEQALVRWLAEQTQGEPVRNDDHIVRLESDSDLVKVVTVHASKGLEYPLVFLPFASGFRAVERRTTRMVSLADDLGERSLHLHLNDEHLAAADRERHREDLRLLYVALTRARHAVWVGLAALKAGRGRACLSHQSAIGYLLHGGEVAEGQLRARVAEAVAGSPDIALEDAVPGAGLPRTPLAARDEPGALLAAEPYAGVFQRHWSIGSFSALVRDLPWLGAAASSVAVVREDEAPNLAERALQPLPVDGAPVAADAGTPTADAPWHRFPRGALPGNFLHDQLEWLAGEGFDLAGNPERAAQLQRRCERQGWGERFDDVAAWLQAVIDTPLPPLGAALSGVGALLPEMEFWFPVDHLAAARVDAICRAGLLDGDDRPMLPERELQGMLMGFADLVFEHEGRYWVLDYKSNHLGDTDADYRADNLRRAIAEHRYDVQAAVYLLALHRLLRSRLGAGYDPVEHLGGAVFFFLRGVAGSTAGCFHVPPSAALLDALDGLLPRHRKVAA